MEIQVLNHACVRLADAVVLYTDPFGLSAHANDADLIFITHMHHDHFSPLDIAKVRKEGTVLVLPKNELPRIAHVGFNARNVVGLSPGETREVRGIHFTGIPAYNRGEAVPHPREKGWLGYLIEIDGKKVYVMGDTDDTPEARAVTCQILVVPVDDRFTFLPAEAAGIAAALSPEIAVPCHWGAIAGSEEMADEFISLLPAHIRGEKFRENTDI